MSFTVKMITITLCLLVFLPTGACASRALVTHLPLWCLVRSVAGEGWEVEMLVRPGTDVHSFSLRPGDLKAIKAADVVFKNGAGLEAHLEKGLSTSGHVVDASVGIELIRSEGGQPNPHVWLDPLLASGQVDSIAEYFVRDSAAADRAARLKGKLALLHREAQRRLRPLRGMALVTYHESFAYFARRYGLRTYSLTGPNSETPLPGRVRGIFDMTREETPAAVFIEAGYPDKALRKLARDLGLRVCTLDTLTSGLVGSGPVEADYYIDGMRRNIETISRCLGGGNG